MSNAIIEFARIAVLKHHRTTSRRSFSTNNEGCTCPRGQYAKEHEERNRQSFHTIDYSKG